MIFLTDVNYLLSFYFVLGEEVALYCAQNLHKFVLDHDGYLEGDLKTALRDSFMNIDQALRTEEVSMTFIEFQKCI